MIRIGNPKATLLQSEIRIPLLQLRVGDPWCCRTSRIVHKVIVNESGSFSESSSSQISPQSHCASVLTVQTIPDVQPCLNQRKNVATMPNQREVTLRSHNLIGLPTLTDFYALLIAATQYLQTGVYLLCMYLY